MDDKVSSDGRGATAPVSVLFVCLGNICRSPMAHAVLQSMTASLPTPPIIDSAGTGAYHSLSPPDPRTMQTLRRHGINDFDHAARKVRADDFVKFDYILAMDEENLEDLMDLRKRATAKGKLNGADEGSGKVAKVGLFGRYSGKVQHEVVEDPYYGGGKGFEIAYEQCVRFSKRWLKEEMGVEA